MKFFSDQRRLYGLAAVLLVMTVALCCTWGLWQKPSGTTGGNDVTAITPTGAVETQAPQTSPAPEATNQAANANASGEETAQAGDGVKTIVYYQDNNGYLVPVMRTIANQPGIAKATLGMMVQSPANDMEAARLGLRTVLPEGTNIDLDISGGVARIDLSEEVAGLPDAEAEANMVSAVVQTLTEFPTVEKVSFLIDGKAAEALSHGTSISGEFTRGMLNLESASADLKPDEAKTVMLYFPGETGSLIVPVTRMVYGSADVNTAVLELAKGPSAASPLDTVLPSGCGLIDVKNADGKVQINFTKEFIELAQDDDGGRQALRALVLTCSQFEGVKSVEIQVEGEPYDPGADTLSIPTFVNDAEAVADQFLQTQSNAIFEVD